MIPLAEKILIRWVDEGLGPFDEDMARMEEEITNDLGQDEENNIEPTPHAPSVFQWVEADRSMLEQDCTHDHVLIIYWQYFWCWTYKHNTKATNGLVNDLF